MDEASKSQFPVVGHADRGYVGVERAFRARQQIEHLDGYMEAFLKPDAPMQGSVSDRYIYNPENWKSIDYMKKTRLNEVPLEKRADLVLLNANPLEDIRNTMNRDGVMLAGKYYPQSLLNKWLDAMAPRFANAYIQH